MANQAENLNTPNVDTRINARQKYAGFYPATLDLFGNVLQHVWGADVPVVYIGAAEDLRTLMRQEGKITFPYFAVRVEQVEENKQSYNINEAARKGIKLKASDSGQAWFKLAFKPVIAHLNVEFVTNNMAHCHKFIETYLFRRRQLTFELAFDGAADGLVPYIPIQVMGDDSLTIDQTNYEGQDGKLHTISFQIQLSTYVGVIYSTPTIASISIKAYMAKWENEVEKPELEEFEVFTIKLKATDDDEPLN